MKMESRLVKREEWQPFADKIIGLIIDHFDDGEDLIKTCSIVLASFTAVEETLKLYLEEAGVTYKGVTMGKDP